MKPIAEWTTNDDALLFELVDDGGDPVLSVSDLEDDDSVTLALDPDGIKEVMEILAKAKAAAEKHLRNGGAKTSDDDEEDDDEDVDDELDEDEDEDEDAEEDEATEPVAEQSKAAKSGRKK